MGRETDRAVVNAQSVADQRGDTRLVSFLGSASRRVSAAFAREARAAPHGTTFLLKEVVVAALESSTCCFGIDLAAYRHHTGIAYLEGFLGA